MGKTLHIRCRRCGRRAYHVTKRQCSACGYGESPRTKRYSWRTKSVNRRRLAPTLVRA